MEVIVRRRSETVFAFDSGPLPTGVTAVCRTVSIRRDAGKIPVAFAVIAEVLSGIAKRSVFRDFVLRSSSLRNVSFLPFLPYLPDRYLVLGL